MVHLKLMQFEKIFDTSPFSHSRVYVLQVIAYIYIASMPKKLGFFPYNWFVEYRKTFKIQIIYVTWLFDELLHLQCLVIWMLFLGIAWLNVSFLCTAKYVTCTVCTNICVAITHSVTCPPLLWCKIRSIKNNYA